VVVRFFDETGFFKLKGKRKIAKLLKYAATTEKTKIDYLSCIFVTDKDIKELNKCFLKHTYSTDIITFCMCDPEDKKVIADLFVGVETVKKNAEFYKVTFQEEILRVIIHGLLHICGYKDKKAEDIKTMRELEDKYLKIYDEVANL